MNNQQQSTPELLAMMQGALNARDFEGAERIAEVVSVREPGREIVVEYLIARALHRGDRRRALNVARGGVSANPDSARLRFQLGIAEMADERHATAVETFARAHSIDPSMTVAFLWQADCEQILGHPDARLRSQMQALSVAERNGQLARLEQVPQPVRLRIERAIDAVRAGRREVLENAFAPLRAKYGSPAIARIERAFAPHWSGPALTPPNPLQRPTMLFVPDLPDQAWFERDQFPYLTTLEAATDVIREELLGVLADESVFEPYVDMPDTAPAAPVWKGLNRSPAWSAYHLYRHGERIAEHCARCPKTMEVLESLSLMRIPDHAPEILFSVLKPRTRIPPHTGVINGRLTVHLPLIVPENCGALRAGDEQRPWRVSECLIFDDSFFHEAWNDSDQTRVVLILDAWNPYLTQPEREALATATAEFGAFHRRYGAEDITRESH